MLGWSNNFIKTDEQKIHSCADPANSVMGVMTTSSMLFCFVFGRGSVGSVPVYLRKYIVTYDFPGVSAFPDTHLWIRPCTLTWLLPTGAMESASKSIFRWEIIEPSLKTKFNNYCYRELMAVIACSLHATRWAVALISNNVVCATSKVSDQPEHRAVWSEPLLVAWIFFDSLATYWT